MAKGSTIQAQLKLLPNLIVTVEVGSVEEMFEVLGPIQEIGGECECGKCGGKQIRFLHRKTADGKHDVYELLCDTVKGNKRKCGARLALGQNTDGSGLFPRRYAVVKDDDGKWVPKTDGDGNKVFLPNGGWVHWDRNANNGEGGYV